MRPHLSRALTSKLTFSDSTRGRQKPRKYQLISQYRKSVAQKLVQKIKYWNDWSTIAVIRFRFVTAWYEEITYHRAAIRQTRCCIYL